MTGRQPLQSTNNLPTSSHRPLVPTGALTKKAEHSGPVRVPPSANGPVRVPGFTKPTSVSKPLVSSSMRPLGTSSSGSKPELGPKPSTGVRPQQTSSAFRSQSNKPPVQSSSAAKTALTSSKPQAPADSKPPASTEQSSGLEGLGGLGSGGKTHRWKLEDFDIGRPLGKVQHLKSLYKHFSTYVRFLIKKSLLQGKFGNVYLAREKASKYIVALKVLFKSQLQKAQVEHQLR